MQDYSRPQIEAAVRLALENVLSEGVDDILARPLELGILATQTARDKVVNDLVSRIIAGNSASLAPRRLLDVWVPKRLLFDQRRVAWMDPVDAVVFLALVLLAHERIESARIPTTESRVFSYRRAVNGPTLWAPHSEAQQEFIAHVRARRSEPSTAIIVKCDVANYYERINLHRLEMSLRHIGVGGQLCTMLNELLTAWAGQNSFGLPVGGNASRVLAEVAMHDIDTALLAHGVDYSRYVDDFRLFAPNIMTAHRWIEYLVPDPKPRIFASELSTPELMFRHCRTRLHCIRDLLVFPHVLNSP